MVSLINIFHLHRYAFRQNLLKLRAKKQIDALFSRKMSTFVPQYG